MYVVTLMAIGGDYAELRHGLTNYEGLCEAPEYRERGEGRFKVLWADAPYIRIAVRHLHDVEYLVGDETTDLMDPENGPLPPNLALESVYDLETGRFTTQFIRHSVRGR
jgi:hypothetical protein